MTINLHHRWQMKLFDSEYHSLLLRIAVPIMIQQFVMSSVNMMDVIMIGQLGDQAVAAVGLANQFSFILIIMLFGIGSGSAIFTAQFWGNHDIPNIRKVLGICLAMCFTAGTFFTVMSTVFPAQVMRILSPDPEVISLGSKYLRLVGIGYFPYALTISFASMLRSIQNVKLPMIVSTFALGLKTIMNYALIFGNFGFPAMGVEGAGLSTCIARGIEFIVLIFLVYMLKTPLAAKPREMIGASAAFVKIFIKTSLPVAVNETLWSLGMTTYNVIFANISTKFVTAVNISNAVENMAFVFLIGMMDASAVIVGSKIGANDEAKAYDYAKRSIIINVVLGILLGASIFLLSGAILSLYKVSLDAQIYARSILTIMSCALWIKASNMMIVVGVLRSGGDTKFAFFLDVGTLWGVGVPLVMIGAFVFHLPIQWVYLLMISDELAKLFIGLARFVSKRWINNLTQVVSGF